MPESDGEGSVSAERLGVGCLVPPIVGCSTAAAGISPCPASTSSGTRMTAVSGRPANSIWWRYSTNTASSGRSGRCSQLLSVGSCVITLILACTSSTRPPSFRTKTWKWLAAFSSSLASSMEAPQWIQWADSPDLGTLPYSAPSPALIYG